LFRFRSLERRRDALRFELGSDTHYEDLSLAVRLTTAELTEVFEDSDGSAASFGAELLNMVSKAVEERLTVPVLLETLELATKPRKRDGWHVRRFSPFMDVMYLEAEPTNAGYLGGGKGLVHSRWVGEKLRDVAGRWGREDAEELARRLGEDEDVDLFEAVPEWKT
jgi:hypothetical protein